MTLNCPDYVAPHRAQLGADGGKYGGVNCTASSAARTLDGGTCGTERFTGAQIRAATNEPIPDPRSPGLNIDQTDAAVFRLTDGTVNLDTRHGYDVDLAIDRIIGGEYAIIQFQRQSLINLGLGFGVGFAKGHAASVDGVNGLHIDDPLTRRFPVTPAQFRAICGSLVLSTGPIGVGKAYISFSPDVSHDWTLVLPTYRYWTYPVNEATRTLSGPRVRVKRGYGDHVPCGSPRRFTDPHNYAGGRSRSLVVAHKGFLTGSGIQSSFASMA